MTLDSASNRPAVKFRALLGLWPYIPLPRVLLFRNTKKRRPLEFNEAQHKPGGLECWGIERLR